MKASNISSFLKYFTNQIDFKKTILGYFNYCFVNYFSLIFLENKILKKKKKKLRPIPP